MTNLLPLDSFRHEMAYMPWHWWGLSGPLAPISSACNALIPRYSWQDADAVGREEIARAIETAEQRLTEYLGFAPAPHYVSETLSWPQYLDKALWTRGQVGSDGRTIAVKLSEGEVQAIGTEAITLLSNRPVVYSDADGDTLDETFVITCATTETDPARIAIYVAAADRLDSAPLGADWRIEPVTVTIAGGTATIRGRRWLMVKPVLYEGVNPATLDPATAANFITTVDVCTRTTDSTNQATLIWESPPWPDWCASSSDPAAWGTATARVGIRDAQTGLVTPGAAVYDATLGTWSADWCGSWRQPDRVVINYLAGAALDGGHMARRWQTIVARLAAAELTRRICACDAANRELYTWQADLARTNKDEVMGAISPSDLMNPLGTRRGHVYAWKAVLKLGHATGILA